ncbi:MAG: acyltransferase family protein [Tahibacter sp.]
MPPEHRLQYRKDIEGLRAIAILLVVGAHAKMPWLPGGFIGVDVFFVLSGFLITGLLTREAQTTGNIHIASFYARRFRRLLPGLLTMLAVVSVLGAAMLAVADQPPQAAAAASAAIWISNFHFALSELMYFGQGAESNLFLHTWSLGVEEQFYLVWPAFVITILGLWKLGKPRVELHHLRVAMLVIFGASLLTCVIQTEYVPHLAFYLMPTRAWQFALGGMIFLYGEMTPEVNEELSGHRARDGATRNRLMWGIGWMGLVCIVGSGIFIDANFLYPGAWALFPSVGTAMVLATCRHPTKAKVHALLSVPPLQAIGRVSYAWYLWHWPILLLGGTTIRMDSGFNRLSLAALSLLIALASFRWVEAPARRQTLWTRRPLTVVLSSSAAMLLASALALRWQNASADLASQPEQTRYQDARNSAPIIYAMGCDDGHRSSNIHLCSFGPDDAVHTAVAIGDSIGLQWFPAIAEVFERPGWRLLVLTKSACPMVNESLFYSRLGREYTECASWRRDALALLAKIKPDVVVLGSSFTYLFTQDQWLNGTQSVLGSISPIAQHIYLLRSTPVLPFDGPSCLAPGTWLSTRLSPKKSCTAPAYDQHADDVYAWLQQSASHFPNVEPIDMTDAVCPDGLCRAERDGVIVFRDSQHLSAVFAHSLANQLTTRLHLADQESE